MIVNSNDETNFPHKSLLTDTQVSKIRKAFISGSSANIKFLKTHLSKMIHSGGFSTFNPINPSEIVSKIISKVEDLFNKVALNDAIKTDNTSRKILRDLKKIFETGITRTNNEKKDIIKIIKYSENRGILLKGTTTKIASQEGGFLNFLKPLMTVGLLLMKNVLTPLAKSVLIPLGLTAATATYIAIQNKIYGSGSTALTISNEELEDIMEKVK